jgi:hypothetical protein
LEEENKSKKKSAKGQGSKKKIAKKGEKKE